MTETVDTFRSVSVLVVDDEPDIADSTAAVLALHGCEANAAHGGEEALTAIEEHAPDVVLLDLLMPGIDGFELVRRIRGRKLVKRPLLVAVTACGSEDDYRRSAQAGVDLHLVKPIEPAFLVGVIHRFSQVLVTLPA